MKKILAIDDTLDNLITIKAVLRNRFPDFEILIALSGEEGIEIAKKEHLDLIILDIIMPKMDGFEVLQLLKADAKTKSIPVVLLTAIKSDTASRVKGLEFGADAFLSKPIDIDELTAHIDVVLRTKEAQLLAIEKNIELEKVVDEKLEELKFQATVLENVIDAVITTDLNFNITTWNNGAESIYGFSKEEAIGQNIDKFLKTEFVQTPNEIILEEISRKGFFRGEINHHHKNGKTLNIFRAASVIKNKEGKSLGYVSVNRDFTYRKKAEIELRKLSEAVEQSPASVIITNLHGEIEYVNQTFENITGYTLSEVVGKNPKFLSSGNKTKEQYKILWDTISKGEIWRGEFYNQKKNGELFWEEALIKPIFNVDGKSINYIAVKLDITENKKNSIELLKAKEKAEESEDLLKETQKVARLGSYVWDISSNLWESSNILDEILGIDETYNRSLEGWLNIIHPNSRNLIHQYVTNEVLGKQLKFDKEYLIIKQNNGEERWVHGLGELKFDKNGLPIKLIGTISDINERKMIEIELVKAKEKAEENDRLKSAFLANMSHEIRTPMNAILGFSDLLMNQELSNSKQEKYNEIVNASGKRLMNLISSIVDISKIDAKELILNPSVFNLNKLLDQLQHQFLISPKNKNTSITVDKGMIDQKSFINSDETRLTQVLSNLLENALKFTKNGTVNFGYNLNENKLHFYVKDSGVGINAKDHQHIFERFGQSDNEILKVKEGSGLGLAISKGIVELFGGQIWVESEPYKGATFHFTIPNCVVITKEESRNDNPNKNTKIASTKTILVAEDEETNFWFLEAALDGHPFKLIHMLNGKNAVEELQHNNSIDLILMDINMPVMNGLEATKEIRKTHPSIPIIAITAYAMTADKEKAMTAGCTDYLSKPVSKTLLLETINKY